MQKYTFSKLGLITCIAVLAATIHVHADMATASGILADIYSKATEANNAWAAASIGGDPVAIAAAQDKVNAVAAAAKEAADAYAKLEQSKGNNPDAEQQIQAAQAAAATAMGNTPPASTPAPGGQGGALPNPHAILWQSPELQGLYENLYNIVQSASAQGGAEFSEAETEITGI